jgi:hypothetical protein
MFSKVSKIRFTYEDRSATIRCNDVQIKYTSMEEAHARAGGLMASSPCLGWIDGFDGDAGGAGDRTRGAFGKAGAHGRHALADGLPGAERAYALEEGRIVANGPPCEQLKQPHIREAYLGV